MTKFDGYLFQHAVPLDDGDYELVLNDTLDAAVGRIWMAMFFINVYPFSDVDLRVRNIFKVLRSAANRNVDVRVLLDTGQGNADISAANMLAYDLLIRNGIDCHFYAGQRMSLHSKYVIIDNDAVLLGSHNLTHNAFAKHRETSILIRSADLALALSRQFEYAWSDAIDETNRLAEKHKKTVARQRGGSR